MQRVRSLEERRRKPDGNCVLLKLLAQLTNICGTGKRQRMSTVKSKSSQNGKIWRQEEAVKVLNIATKDHPERALSRGFMLPEMQRR